MSAVVQPEVYKIVIDLLSSRLRAVSLFLKNPWERTQNKYAVNMTVSAHSHAHTLTCFAFFPTDFRGKERLLAV